MALIVSERYVGVWIGGAPIYISDEASKFYLSIDSHYLSAPYSLSIGDRTEGEILVIKDTASTELNELRGRRISFIIFSALEIDNLFITKRDWEQNFREYGLVQYFWLSVKLEKAIKSSGEEFDLYTKRDVNI